MYKAVVLLATSMPGTKTEGVEVRKGMETARDGESSVSRRWERRKTSSAQQKSYSRAVYFGLWSCCSGLSNSKAWRFAVL